MTSARAQQTRFRLGSLADHNAVLKRHRMRGTDAELQETYFFSTWFVRCREMRIKTGLCREVTNKLKYFKITGLDSGPEA